MTVCCMLYGAAGDVLSFIKVVSRGSDAVFDAQDVLPFLGLHYVQVRGLARAAACWHMLVSTKTVELHLQLQLSKHQH